MIINHFLRGCDNGAHSPQQCGEYIEKRIINLNVEVAKLVDAHDSGSCG